VIISVSYPKPEAFGEAYRLDPDEGYIKLAGMKASLEQWWSQSPTLVGNSALALETVKIVLVTFGGEERVIAEVPAGESFSYTEDISQGTTRIDVEMEGQALTLSYLADRWQVGAVAPAIRCWIQRYSAQRLERDRHVTYRVTRYNKRVEREAAAIHMLAANPLHTTATRVLAQAGYPVA